MGSKPLFHVFPPIPSTHKFICFNAVKTRKYALIFSRAQMGSIYAISSQTLTILRIPHETDSFRCAGCW